MKKALIIAAASVTAIATPASIYAAKRLDTSSVAPTIVSDSEEWSKKASISVSTDATFGGSELDHYEYCISTADSAEDCEWKTSSVNTVRVRNLGTSYIWFRGVSKYGVISDISNYVITRIDRTKPTAAAEITTTTSTIAIAVTATDESDIKSYEYSINNSEYVTDGENHTFDGLDAGTTYNIKIKTTDLAGNSKYLSYDTTTVSNIITNKATKVSTKNSRSSQNLNNVAKASKHEKPEISDESKDNIEKIKEKNNKSNIDKNNDELLIEITENNGQTESSERAENSERTEDNEQTENQADIGTDNETEEIVVCEDSIVASHTETENNAEDINNEENSPDQEELASNSECVQAQTPKDDGDDPSNLAPSEQSEEDGDSDENNEYSNAEELDVDDSLIEKEDDSDADGDTL